MTEREPAGALYLGRRDPLEQPAAADEAIQRASDGVDHHPGLRRQRCERYASVNPRRVQLFACAVQVMPPRHAARRRQESVQPGDPGGQRQRGNDCKQPRELGRVRDRPGRDQRCDPGGRQQGATQIVEQFPAADRVDAGACLAEYPRQQLPVAACPAMRACGGHLRMIGKVLEYLDIAHQGAAREGAFQQIVTEHGVHRQAPGSRSLEGVDVVQAFAGEARLAEQILIDIGDGARVQVDARRSGVEALKQGAFRGGRKLRRHARLQDGVSLYDASAGRPGAGHSAGARPPPPAAPPPRSATACRRRGSRRSGRGQAPREACPRRR